MTGRSKGTARAALGSLLTVLLASLGGCGDELRAPDVAAQCNPLGGTSCMFPWPSAAYLEPADTVTGYQLAIPIEAMPANVDGRHVDPTPFNRFDGFSPSGALLVAFPGGVSADGLPPAENPAASLAADSPIVLVDVETRERVALFAEVDMNTNDPAERALIIRPLERMRPAARYAVGIRRSLRAADGGELVRPAAFEALASGGAYEHPLMERLAPRYPEIFAALEDAGVARDDLLLAWDFVTASDEFLTSDLLAMRDAALPLIGEVGEKLTFEASVEQQDTARVHRMMVGTHTAPNFLTDGEANRSVLVRGDDGLPAVDGTYDANFAVILPACVTTAELPIPVVVFGHGLFGSAADYLDGGAAQEIAQDECFVLIAGDWIGLTGRQVTTAALAANDLNMAGGITEKLAQSVINFIALEHIVRGPMRESDLFRLDGQEIIDAERVWYFGASLGGIMGNVFLAYDPHIERGALGVPGGAWSLLIERSFAWQPLQAAALGAYEDQLHYQLLVSLLAMRFEPYDPITTAARVTGQREPLPGSFVKQALVYEALGDSLVHNLATEMVVREMGIGVTTPSLRVPWGIEPLDGPAGSGFSIYDEGVAEKSRDDNVPPAKDNGTHAGVNDRPAVRRQIYQFMREGIVAHQCQKDGAPAPCDCTAGACE